MVSVYAQEIPEIPPIPMFVKGDVYINEKPAPIGTVIEAKIGGKVKANFTVGEKGKFAFPISAEGKDSGKDIVFYADDIPANSTLVLRSGDIIDDASIYITKETKTNKWLGFALVIILLIIIYFLIKRKKAK